MKKIYYVIFISVFILNLYCIVSAQEADPTLEPSFPKPGDRAIAEKSINENTVRIINLKRSIVEKRNPATEELSKVMMISADVCYSTPDIGEWYLHGETNMLRFGSVTSEGWAEDFNYIDEVYADGKTYGEKCVRYKFTFDIETKIEPPITIEFSKMFAIPREAVHPCDEIRKRFETNVRAREAGLKIRCDEAPNDNPPGIDFPYDSSVQLVDYDSEKMTKQEAFVLMLEIESGVIYGPWIFKITPTN